MLLIWRARKMGEEMNAPAPYHMPSTCKSVVFVPVFVYHHPLSVKTLIFF